MKVLFVILLLTIAMPMQVSYDVHLKVPSDVEEELIRISEKMTKLCPHNEVNFSKTIPHITMYLTVYDEENLANMTQAVSKVVSQLKQFEVVFDRPYISGQYFMWKVRPSIAMQTLSDIVVTQAKDFISANQTVPDWVYQLPDEDDKQQKITYVEQFGSPGVFDMFDPHVTMGWDDVDDMNIWLKEIDFPQIRFTASVIGVGLVSDHGTVLRGSDIARFNLRKK